MASKPKLTVAIADAQSAGSDRGIEAELADALAEYARLREEIAMRDARDAIRDARDTMGEARLAGTLFPQQWDFLDRKDRNLPEANGDVTSFCRNWAQAKAIPRYDDITRHLFNEHGRPTTDISKLRPAYYGSSPRVAVVVWKRLKKAFRGAVALLSPRTARNEEVDPSCSYQDSNTSAYEKANRDILGGTPGQVAHCLPHSPSCASCWSFVTASTLGFDVDRKLKPVVYQMLIHGVRRKWTIKRLAHSGLKHNHCNKHQLEAQGEIYDNEPYMLLIPMMKRGDMLDWQGGAYSVMVLLNDTAKYGKFLHYCDVCTDRGEVENALELLNAYTLWLAKNRSRQAPKVPHATANLRKRVRQKSAELGKFEEDGVPYLAIKTGIEFGGENGIKVATRLVPRDGPDPLLLLAKAAVNLCNQAKRKLLPDCSTVDSSEGSTDWTVKPAVVPPTCIVTQYRTADEDCSVVSDLD